MSKVALKSKINRISPNPTLDTIKMVEQALSKILQYPSKNSLWRALPRQVQYPTFKEVLDYLQESNKIMYDKDGAIIWIFADNAKLKKLLKTSKSLL
ncbi:MAG: hypothetical protein ACREBI_04140 [Nitrosotalea sp.]